MNKSEAQKILGEELEQFGRRDYSELQRFVESQHVEDFEVIGASGTRYGGEVQFFWDDKRKGGVRVVASIDDGGFRTFVPLTQTLLIPRPEGMSA